MEELEDIVSGFGRADISETPFRVDFGKAKRMETSGSTCDAYVYTMQHRRVFVKRLKARFRGNPLYITAFRKEYELGVSLSHPSLPRYVGLGDDYIVMDFVEGDTLSDLIKRNDYRLRSGKFVRKILDELTDVVEYLHNRHIIHCDIKADNIIISPYRDRPLTLLDFDKAYTSWLDDTAGDPSKYNCEGCADGTIDFHGIGRIADKLGQKQVAAACNAKDVSPESVRKALSRNHSRAKALWGIIVAAVLITVAFIAIWLKNGESDTTRATHESDQSAMMKQPKDSIALPEIDASSGSGKTSIVEGRTTLTKEVEYSAEQPPSINPDVDEIVKEYYSRLYRRHEYLRRLAADTLASSRQLQMAISSYVKEQEKAQDTVIREVMNRYGLTDPLEVHSLLGTCGEWKRFMKQDMDINRLYSTEIGKREK